MNKEIKITYKTCKNPAQITLRIPEEIADFPKDKVGFDCGKCALTYWNQKITEGEIILTEKSQEFQETYWEEKKKYESN